MSQYKDSPWGVPTDVALALLRAVWRIILAGVHTSDRRSLRERLWRAETNGCVGEESRLKAGCSQDWLPHKVLHHQRPGRGFLGSVNAARMSACAMSRGRGT